MKEKNSTQTDEVGEGQGDNNIRRVQVLHSDGLGLSLGTAISVWHWTTSQCLKPPILKWE